jgi:transcriptional regulator with XRE-family HTH domain
VLPELDPKTRRAAVEIGRRIHDARLAADLSQEALAKKARMTRGNLARIEQGRTNVTLDSLLRIAGGLGLDLAFAFVSRKRRRST